MQAWVGRPRFAVSFIVGGRNCCPRLHVCSKCAILCIMRPFCVIRATESGMGKAARGRENAEAMRQLGTVQASYLLKIFCGGYAIYGQALNLDPR